MCGRFVAAASPQLLAERFEVEEVDIGEREPDYNVTPRAMVPVVRQRPRREVPTRVLSLLRWGLVPSWAESPAVGDRLINARAESVAEKASFAPALRKRRCIVPADAFYEWEPGARMAGGRSTRAKRVEDRRRARTPYLVRRRDGEPLAFAGLWEIWRDPAVGDSHAPDAWLRTCTIITTSANALLAPIHERMPVVLPQAEWARWLDPAAPVVDALDALLAPAPDDWFEVYPVSPRVNSPEHNDAALLEPAAAEDPVQATVEPELFDGAFEAPDGSSARGNET